MKISSCFDGGNIHVIKCDRANDIQLAIRKDSNSDHFQWFYFRLEGAKEKSCRLRLTNAGKSSYPGAWSGYNAVASYDRDTWFRVPTKYENNELIIEYTPGYNVVYFAYFAPYSFERHQDLIARAQLSERCEAQDLGLSIEGRDLTLLTVGDSKNATLKFWVIARQHPGETMAEWFVEGFLERLLDVDDPVVKKLLQYAVFYIVPNMNPDGSVLGNLRTNAAGINLNRVWHSPDKKTSPEVYTVLEKMKETGVDFFLDVHGDEELPYNFLCSASEIPRYNPHLAALENKFKARLLQVSPDFQTTHGYMPGRFTEEMLTLAVNAIVNRFQCLGFTLEMPFKDNANLPDVEMGWSPNRCFKLAHAIIDAIYSVYPTNKNMAVMANNTPMA